MVQTQAGDIELALNAAGFAANEKPGAKPIVLVKGQFGTSGETPLVFPSGAGEVSFRAQAGELLGIYPDFASLQEALGARVSLDLETRPGTHYALLRWPYDLAGTANGAVAFAPYASATLATSACSNGYYAVIREIPDGPVALDILAELLASLRIPRQVRTLNDLAPGSRIIADIDGSFKLGVTATCGYDLSWVRQVEGGAWTGDVGLRVLAGLEAQLGFEIAGQHTIVLSRALSGQQIRLQVHKANQAGWNIGLRGGITAVPSQNGLPQSADDLLKGILGIHATQILNGLRQFEQWTDPNSPQFGPLGNLSNEIASQIVRNVTGVADLNTAFNEAKSRLGQFFALWNQLPQQTAALLWSKLPHQMEIQQIASFAAKISNLEAGSSGIPFESGTPVGQFLESLVSTNVLNLLGDGSALQQVGSMAGVVSKLLNGAELASFLQRLQKEIDKRLYLQQIEQAVASADLNKLDAWMEKRLEAFFHDHARINLEKLARLREQLHRIVHLKDELYTKALDALRRQYTFTLTETYQSAGSITALVDLVFDFARDASGAERALRLALDGRFDEVLLDSSNTGVSVNQGILTHGIRRQTSVELALPFADITRIHVTDALATMKAVDQAGGRLLLYSGAFHDLREVRNQWQSTLSIGLMAGRVLAPDVAVHSPPQAVLAYSESRAMRALTRSRLRQRWVAEFDNYFARSKTLDQWLDGFIGAGNDAIGNALVSFDVSLPPEFVLAWLKAPFHRNAIQYRTMSAMVRRKFREFLLEQYFGDVNRYGDVADGSPALTLLVFTSALGGSSELLARLRDVRDILAGAGRDDLADYYADEQAGRIAASAMRSPAMPLLCAAEGKIVDSARTAALTLAQFRTSEFRNPARARKALAAFGAKVADTFHGALETYATGSALLPLGTLLFAEAARAFDPSLEPSRARAMFSLQVVDCQPFPPAGFPENRVVAPASVVLESRIVNAPAATIQRG